MIGEALIKPLIATGVDRLLVRPSRGVSPWQLRNGVRGGRADAPEGV